MKCDTQLSDLISKWSQYLTDTKSYSKNTCDSYIADLIKYISFINLYCEITVSLEQILKSDIRLIRSWLAARQEDGYNNSSTLRALSAIKNFYRYIERYHNSSTSNSITSHPIFIIKPPKKSHSLPRALKEEEVFTACDSIVSASATSDMNWLTLRNKALLILIYSSGLRISEALKISKEHIKNPEYIKITGKGNRERVIPWIASVKGIINSYLEALPFELAIHEPIFRGVKGMPLSRSTFSKDLINLRRKLGLPECTSAHSFRHSFATHLLENGSDMKSIQELLGHKNLSSTQIYTKINASYLESIYTQTHPNAKNKT